MVNSNRRGYSSEFRPKNNKTNKEKEAVASNYDLPLFKLESYFTTNDIQNGNFFKAFIDYKESNLNYETEPFSTLLQKCANEKLLRGNKEFYSEISIFLDYASQENLLHKNKKHQYENFLKRVLFEDNKDSIDNTDTDSLEILDYSKYESNNFRKTDSNKAINKIHQMGGAIFLNSDGKICCRFSKDSELKIYSKREAEMMLSSVLKFQIKITEDVPTYSDIDTSILLPSEATFTDVDDEKE